MAKCIMKGDEIKRVSEKDAVTNVKAGWKYCKKSEWKEKGGKREIPVQVVEAEGVKKNKYSKKGKRSKKEDDVAATVEATKV